MTTNLNPMPFAEFLDRVTGDLVALHEIDRGIDTDAEWLVENEWWHLEELCEEAGLNFDEVQAWIEPKLYAIEGYSKEIEEGVREYIRENMDSVVVQPYLEVYNNMVAGRYATQEEVDGEFQVTSYMELDWSKVDLFFGVYWWVNPTIKAGETHRHDAAKIERWQASDVVEAFENSQAQQAATKAN